MTDDDRSLDVIHHGHTLDRITRLNSRMVRAEARLVEIESAWPLYERTERLLHVLGDRDPRPVSISDEDLDAGRWPIASHIAYACHIAIASNTNDILVLNAAGEMYLYDDAGIDRLPIDWHLWPQSHVEPIRGQRGTDFYRLKLWWDGYAWFIRGEQSTSTQPSENTTLLYRLITHPEPRLLDAYSWSSPYSIDSVHGLPPGYLIGLSYPHFQLYRSQEKMNECGSGRLPKNYHSTTFDGTYIYMTVRWSRARWVDSYVISELFDTNAEVDSAIKPFRSISIDGWVMDFTCCQDELYVLESTRKNPELRYEFLVPSRTRYRISKYVSQEYVGSFEPQLDGVRIPVFSLAMNDERIVVVTEDKLGSILVYRNPSKLDWTLLPPVLDWIVPL